jgi:hypothetical protein
MHSELRFEEGIFEELDAPGEWFLDQDNTTLYFYPPEGIDLENAIIDIVRLVNLVEIGAEHDATVCGITLRDNVRFLSHI